MVLHNMTSIDVPRNTSQRAGLILRVEGRLVNADTGIYTCPNGKRARVTDMVMRVDALGSAAAYHIAIRGASSPFPFKKITNRATATAPNDVVSASAITMVAGEKLTDIGSDGTSKNGTVNISATVEEFQV